MRDCSKLSDPNFKGLIALSEVGAMVKCERANLLRSFDTDNVARINAVIDKYLLPMA